MNKTKQKKERKIEGRHDNIYRRDKGQIKNCRNGSGKCLKEKQTQNKPSFSLIHNKEQGH